MEAQFNEGPKNTMRGRVHKNGGLLNLTKTCQSQMSILDIVYCNYSHDHLLGNNHTHKFQQNFNLLRPDNLTARF